MKSERIISRVLGEWTVPAIGGDAPGMIKGEMPLKGQDIWREIGEEHSLGLIPKGKKRGVAILGPIRRPDGRRVTVVYKIEYNEM